VFSGTATIRRKELQLLTRWGAAAVILGGALLLAGCGHRDTDTPQVLPNHPAPTTTTATTVPPSTARVPMATVPDAAEAGRDCGCRSVPARELGQTGCTYQFIPVTNNGCFITASGRQEWEAGAVLGQYPIPGSTAPVGSMVAVHYCAVSANSGSKTSPSCWNGLGSGFGDGARGHILAL
jgi:hypothetical protein